jgi:hypothetical protein
VQTVDAKFLPVLRDALLRHLGPYGLLILEDTLNGAHLKQDALSTADARGLMRDLVQQLPDDQRPELLTLQSDLERRFGL